MRANGGCAQGLSRDTNGRGPRRAESSMRASLDIAESSRPCSSVCAQIHARVSERVSERRDHTQ